MHNKVRIYTQQEEQPSNLSLLTVNFADSHVEAFSAFLNVNVAPQTDDDTSPSYKRRCKYKQNTPNRQTIRRIFLQTQLF